jgi:hypothetical protein
MKKPNFFILGAPKCGTTSLAAWLSQHPQVYMSAVKEPNFFNTDQLELHRPTRREYEKLFEPAQESHLAVGEASVRYLSSQVAVPAILEFQPDARFIVAVRNPIEMAFSLHKQWVFSGAENLTSFENAWRAQEDRAQGRRLPPLGYPNQYGEFCSVGKQIRRLYRLVDQARVRIVFLDDIRAEPASVYADVSRFLGVRDDHVPDFKMHNPSQERKYPWLRQLSIRAGLLKRAVGIRRGLGLIGALDNWNTTEKGWTASSPMVAELKEYFRRDVAELEEITGRNLSSWLNDELTGPVRAATDI